MLTQRKAGRPSHAARELGMDNPAWVDWTAPVLKTLRAKGPCTLPALRKALRKKQIVVKGGLANAICWLEHYGFVSAQGNVWHAVGTPAPPQAPAPSFATQAQAVADQYKVTVADILGPAAFGPCVMARDTLFGTLAAQGHTPAALAAHFGLPQARVEKAIARYNFRATTRGQA